MPYEITNGRAVEVHGLHKSFKDQEVLRGVDLEIAPGTTQALLGPNGAGKTTMVRILSTLTRPGSGTVRVGGHDVTTDPTSVRRTIGLTGQYAAIDGLLTGKENLVMVARLNGLDRSRADIRADQLLEQFGLIDAARRRASTYSGGMKRRLDLAASLVVNPKVVFLDEPTTGLDPRARQTIWETIRNLVDGGTTVLLTTQYLEEADQLADRISVIDDGVIVAEGTPDSLKRQVGAERIHLTFARDEVDAARASLESHSPVVDRESSEVTVTLDRPDQLRDLLNRLHSSGLVPEEISVTRPTLDDVFLTLTGKEAS